MSVSQEELHGRAFETTFSSTLTPDFKRARLWYVEATVVSLNIDLPDATAYRVGGPVGYIVLTSASNTVTIRDNGGTAITLSDGATTLEADECIEILLLDNSDADGLWAAKVYSVAAAGNPSPGEFTYVVGGSPVAQEQRTEEYNHQTDTVTLRTSSGFQHSGGGGFRTGSVGYFFGDNSGSPNDTRNERYTPSADTWLARADNTATFFRGQSNRGGSSSSLGYTLGNANDTDLTQEYDPGANAWTTLTNKTTPCTEGTGGCDPNDPDDSFVMNGTNPSLGVDVTAHERYRASTDIWTSRAAQPAPATRNACAGGFADSMLKVGGNTAVTDTDQYMISGDVWVSKNTFPATTPNDENRNDGPISCPEDDPYLLGGQRGASTLTAEIWNYNPLTDVWTQKTSLGATRVAHNEQAFPITP